MEIKKSENFSSSLGMVYTTAVKCVKMKNAFAKLTNKSDM